MESQPVHEDDAPEPLSTRWLMVWVVGQGVLALAVFLFLINSGCLGLMLTNR